MSMKRGLAAWVTMALATLTASAQLAYRIPCEVQNSDGSSLPDITWMQGTSPLIQLDVLQNGRALTVSNLTMTARMVIGPSATSNYYAEVGSYVTNATNYKVQWPTVGTNSAGAAWFYTVFFETSTARYWTGAGRLYIDETTSTNPDGLTWQTFLANTETDPIWSAASNSYPRIAILNSVTSTVSNGRLDLGTIASGTGDTDAWLADSRARTATLNLGGYPITNAHLISFDNESTIEGVAGTDNLQIFADGGQVELLSGTQIGGGAAGSTNVITPAGFVDIGPTLGKAETAIQSEADPIWAAVSNSITSLALGAVQTEADPVWVATSNAVVTLLNSALQSESDPIWAAVSNSVITTGLRAVTNGVTTATIALTKTGDNLSADIVAGSITSNLVDSALDLVYRADTGGGISEVTATNIARVVVSEFVTPTQLYSLATTNLVITRAEIAAWPRNEAMITLTNPCAVSYSGLLTNDAGVWAISVIINDQTFSIDTNDTYGAAAAIALATNSATLPNDFVFRKVAGDVKPFVMVTTR